MAHVEIHPICSHCRYDVRGLRSNTCPECGREFDLDAPAPRIVGTRLLHTAALAVCTFLGCLISLMQLRVSPWLGMVEFHEGNYQLRDESALLCIAALLGAFYVPISAIVSKRMRVWLLIPPSYMFLNALAYLMHGSPYIISATTLSLVVAALSFMPCAVSSPMRTAAAVSGAFIAWPVIISTRMIVGSSVRSSKNMNWSPWPDPRDGQLYDQYPLTNEEAIWAGVALAVVTMPLVLLWVWFFRHELHRVKSDAHAAYSRVRRRFPRFQLG